MSNINHNGVTTFLSLYNNSYINYTKGKYPKTPNISVGELVHLYTDRNKHRARDRYIVVSVEGEWCNIRKFIGAQLRRMSYRVKLSQCYRVNADIPSDAILYPSRYDDPASDTDQDIISSSSPLSALPPVPAELIMPPQLFTHPQTHQETEHTPEAHCHHVSLSPCLAHQTRCG